MTDPLLEFQPKNKRDLSLDRHVTTIKEESIRKKTPQKTCTVEEGGCVPEK